MNPVMLEVTKLRGLAITIVLAVLMALAGAAGWLVNGWRLDGPHARELAARDATIATLKAAVDQQNAAIRAAGAASAAADDRRKQAETVAARAIDRMKARSAAVATSTATDCAGVLRDSWGAWK